MSYKEKCFGYFSSNKGQEKGDLLKGAVSKFGITRLTAENYYSRWKAQNPSSVDEVAEKAVDYIFGEGEGEEIEKKKPSLTDEMILEELNKIGFSYLSISTNMIKCIANKFNLEEHTAKFRLEELAKKRKVKKEEVKPKLSGDEINELCENTEFEKETVAVDDKPAKPADKPSKDCEESAKDVNKKFGQRLKIALLQGKVMSYEIQEGGFLLRQKSYINSIPVDFKDIDDFIAELRELKEVMA
ncbi:hypothetical protein [Clostridium kluyveri]|uniref:Uncharacterized protein n=1 Tax=Clostridium kluyveri TaxID=1534 RepID=A0A1L5F2U6_CLOKL|nr:hypothetical protein [Clostridium kluyveri]APM37341.1 hypothetical protein BS101_00450 [Clostridium kluyveri]